MDSFSRAEHCELSHSEGVWLVRGIVVLKGWVEKIEGCLWSHFHDSDGSEEIDD